jgi:hypothetical protein
MFATEQVFPEVVLVPIKWFTEPAAMEKVFQIVFL